MNNGPFKRDDISSYLFFVHFYPAYTTAQEADIISQFKSSIDYQTTKFLLNLDS